MFVRSGHGEAIERLLARGLSPNAIARRLGLAEPTVSYHVERIRKARSEVEVPQADEVPLVAAPTHVRTRERVAELLATGLSQGAVAERLGISKATVSYHARRLGRPVDERCARRYDWAAIQAFYDEGNSVRTCQAKFGFSLQTWHEAVNRGAVVARPAALPLDELLVAGRYRSRHNVKLRLLKEGVKAARCEECGLTEWHGRAISFALHHENGDRYDNRIENLRLLCPNYHSQTDTYSGRNRSRTSG